MKYVNNTTHLTNWEACMQVRVPDYIIFIYNILDLSL